MTTKTTMVCQEQDVQHLFKAISKGKAHLTRFMLAASGSPLMNCVNTEGRTPLMECCYIREEATRVNMVKTIRDAGADVNQKDEHGRTALIHACQERCNDVVRILIMHHQIVPDAEDEEGNTALIHCANNGNDIAVELLVRNFRRLGLQIDHFNKEGYTALHIAAKSGFLQCAKILATKGKATLTLKDKVYHLTPLEWCLEEGYQKSEVEFLKPSVKFYKVAKLTTTMVKYRKRSSSGQESISSAASRIAPIAANDKARNKLKFLQKKSKAVVDDGEVDVSTDTSTLPSQPSSDQQDQQNDGATTEATTPKKKITSVLELTKMARLQDGKGERATNKKTLLEMSKSPSLSESVATKLLRENSADRPGSHGTCHLERSYTTGDEHHERSTDQNSFNDRSQINSAVNNCKRGLQRQSKSETIHSISEHPQTLNNNCDAVKLENDIVDPKTAPVIETGNEDRVLSLSPVGNADKDELISCANKERNGKQGHESTSPQTEIEFVTWDDDRSKTVTNDKYKSGIDLHANDRKVVPKIDDVTANNTQFSNEVASKKFDQDSNLRLGNSEPDNRNDMRQMDSGKENNVEGYVNTVYSTGNGSNNCHPDNLISDSLNDLHVSKDACDKVSENVDDSSKILEFTRNRNDVRPMEVVSNESTT